MRSFHGTDNHGSFTSTEYREDQIMTVRNIRPFEELDCSECGYLTDIYADHCLGCGGDLTGKRED